MNDRRVHKGRPVKALMVEIDETVYRGMERYCLKFGRTKRWLVEDAINCWIIQRDMEAKAREDTQ